MNRVPIVIATLGALLAGTQGSATDWRKQTVPTRRHSAVVMVLDCMRKRMSRDQLISYNDAHRVCKEEVARRLDGAPPGTLIAAIPILGSSAPIPSPRRH